MTQEVYTKKTDFTKEQVMHPPQVPPKPKYRATQKNGHHLNLNNL